MKVTWGLADRQPVPHPVLTIGNFDGLHCGHAALLRAVVDRAVSTNGTPLVLTFDPHPAVVLAPHVRLQFLTTQEERLARFDAAGIQEVILLAFTPELAGWSPAEFVLRILRDAVHVREVFVGEHFAFGKGRSGSLADLIRLSRQAQIDVHPVPPLRIDGDVVSSTRIRRLLNEGDVQKAARLLGRAYRLTGTVIEGDHRGRGLGWPTANLRLPMARVIPPDGVYATRAVCEGQSFDAVSYIGTRPTFGPGERLLEVSLLDQQQELYGRTLAVEFIDRVRDDRTFESPDELTAQIERDVRSTRELLQRAAEGRRDA